MSEEAHKTGLTRAMKIAIGAVGVLVIGGVIVAVVLNGTGKPSASATSSPSASHAPGPLPGAIPTEGSEVRPPTATPMSGLPPVEAATPLISDPLPKSASREGGIVDGFPAVAGPLDGSKVGSSSIAVQDTVMQVSLSAVSTASQDDIREHYRTLWNTAGLREQPTADGTTTFAGTYGSLTLSFGSSGTGNLYTVYGVLRTQ